jgi:hypothetical protein
VAVKGSFVEDPALKSAVFDLLDVVFPGVKEGAEQVASLGASWESVSTPFLRFEGGLAVSHIGRLEIPLVLLGRPPADGRGPPGLRPSL